MENPVLGAFIYYNLEGGGGGGVAKYCKIFHIPSPICNKQKNKKNKK